MSTRLKDKVALVTGAGSGIGRATAVALAKEGAKVVVTDIHEDNGKTTETLIRDSNGKAVFLRQDTGDKDNWDRVLNNIREEFGQLDVLVNNAGVLRLGPLQYATVEDWQILKRVNLDGVFLGTKLAIPLMTENDGGSIINVSSVHALKGSPMESLYAATKAAVRIFTKSIALECAELNNNIRVNSVLPGAINTSIIDNLSSKIREQLGDIENLKKQIITKVPLKRIGQSEEIAKGIVYLASDDSSYVTGIDLIIDGGMTA
jgi:NAD(P)-dependent dehydrogenase (short-subunit alcohol dehydrogenase family)